MARTSKLIENIYLLAEKPADSRFLCYNAPRDGCFHDAISTTSLPVAAFLVVAVRILIAMDLTTDSAYTARYIREATLEHPLIVYAKLVATLSCTIHAGMPHSRSLASYQSA